MNRRVFVQPARDEASRINILKSIDRKVSQALLDRLDPYEAQRIRDKLGTEDFRLWAPKASPRNEATWEKMFPGDLVLLYPHGYSKRLRCFEVTGTIESPALGRLVWGATAPGVEFRHLYGLGKEYQCTLTIEDFNEVLGYERNNTIQGFGVYEYTKAQALIASLAG
jgi:hypothetical protein